MSKQKKRKAFSRKKAIEIYLQRTVTFRCKGTGQTLVGTCRNVIIKEGKVLLIVTDVKSRPTVRFYLEPDPHKVMAC